MLTTPYRIGIEALEFTNQFRKNNNLPSLTWHQALCEIGAVHSKNMAEHTVPFGHEGFNERVRRYPFEAISAAENVAMNKGFSSSLVARMAVDGWINSPGHRKNLLINDCKWCGIGVHENADGAWYLTQLFGG